MPQKRIRSLSVSTGITDRNSVTTTGYASVHVLSKQAPYFCPIAFTLHSDSNNQNGYPKPRYMVVNKCLKDCTELNCGHFYMMFYKHKVFQLSARTIGGGVEVMMRVYNDEK